jgi:hypothetical protein
MRLGWGRPTRRAASVNSSMRRGPHAAGWVSVNCPTLPATRPASVATRPSTAARRSRTGTSLPPRSTTSSSTRRFGLGSRRSGLRRARWAASRPVWSRPSGPSSTAEASSGEPSNSSGRMRPSGHCSMAIVVEVPRSTAKRCGRSAVMAGIVVRLAGRSGALRRDGTGWNALRQERFGRGSDPRRSTRCDRCVRLRRTRERPRAGPVGSARLPTPRWCLRAAVAVRTPELARRVKKWGWNDDRRCSKRAGGDSGLTVVR